MNFAKTIKILITLFFVKVCFFIQTKISQGSRPTLLLLLLLFSICYVYLFVLIKLVSVITVFHSSPRFANLAKTTKILIT